jgi:hypothetical protein
MLALTLLNHEASNVGNPLPIGMMPSNQSSVVYSTVTTGAAQNKLAAVTFDSTNRSIFGSSIRFTPTTNLSN